MHLKIVDLQTAFSVHNCGRSNSNTYCSKLLNINLFSIFGNILIRMCFGNPGSYISFKCIRTTFLKYSLHKLSVAVIF